MQIPSRQVQISLSPPPVPLMRLASRTFSHTGWILLRTCSDIQVCMYVCMYTCIHVYMYVHIYTCMYVGTYVRMYICIYTFARGCRVLRVLSMWEGGWRSLAPGASMVPSRWSSRLNAKQGSLRPATTRTNSRVSGRGFGGCWFWSPGFLRAEGPGS